MVAMPAEVPPVSQDDRPSQWLPDLPPAPLALAPPLPPAPPPPTPASVIVARVVLSLQAVVCGQGALATLPLPGRSAATDMPTVPAVRQVLIMAVPVLVVVLAVLLAVFLRRGRRWLWLTALLLNLGLGLSYGWFAYWLVRSPDSTGIGAIAGVMFGPPLVLLCLVGAGALAFPKAIAFCHSPVPTARPDHSGAPPLAGRTSEHA